jgi:hypothetical protein
MSNSPRQPIGASSVTVSYTRFTGRAYHVNHRAMSKMSNAPEDLVRAYEDCALIVCVGPAVSTSLRQLAEHLLTVAAAAGVELDAAYVAKRFSQNQIAMLLGLLRDNLGQMFEREVQDFLVANRRNYPLIEHAIARLEGSLRAVYSTNLDDALERSFAGRWPGLGEARPDFAQRRRIIFRLNGTLAQPQTWALTDEQLEERYREGAPVRRVLQAAWGAHYLLFVGFEADSPELERLLELAPSFDEQLPTHFLVVSHCRPDERRALGRRGLVVIDADAEKLLDSLQPGAQVQGPGNAGLLYRVDGEYLSIDKPTKRATFMLDDTREFFFPGLATVKDFAFFGRSAELGQATTLLDEIDGVQPRWLAIEGACGVGKSSFLSAGIVPAIIGHDHAAGAPRAWMTVVLMRPGQRPVESLVGALCRSLHIDEDGLARAMHERPTAVVEFLSREPRAEGMLLLIDQLEELLTLADEQQRQVFSEAIAAVVEVERFYLVTALRSDFVAKLESTMPVLGELLRTRAKRYTLQPISRAGLFEAITEPARGEVTIEPELVRRIIDDAEGVAHALPKVAHVLRRLWQRAEYRRQSFWARWWPDEWVFGLEVYEAIGGVGSALARSADALVESLFPWQRQRLRALLLALVHVDPELPEARRPLPRASAIELLGGGAKGERLLARLTGASEYRRGVSFGLLVETFRGAPHVELAHEVLLFEWETLRRWRSDPA